MKTSLDFLKEFKEIQKIEGASQLRAINELFGEMLVVLAGTEAINRLHRSFSLAVSKQLAPEQ